LTLENVRPIITMLHEFQIDPPLQVCDRFLERNTISKNIIATGDDVLFAQTFHLEKFLSIAVEQLIQNETLFKFVNDRGDQLILSSWKIITQRQTSEYRKFMELKNAAVDAVNSTRNDYGTSFSRVNGASTSPVRVIDATTQGSTINCIKTLEKVLYRQIPDVVEPKPHSFFPERIDKFLLMLRERAAQLYANFRQYSNSRS
jgi:hypothetical protein